VSTHAAPALPEARHWVTLFGSIRPYRRAWLSRDVVAGVTLAALAIPEVMGYTKIASPKVELNQLSGTLVRFWDALKELGQTSGATLAVSLAVLATLIVFERWIRMVPGGLVAVVGAIALGWIFDFSAHGVSVLGPVPSGLPHIGFPKGVTWSETTALLATSVSIFFVILAQSAARSRAYAVKYQEDFVENDDLVGLSAANLAAGLSSTFVVNASPTKTEMVDEAKSHTQVAQLTTAAVVALVLLFLTKPLQYLPNAVLSAVVFLIGIKLVDVVNMRRIWRLRRDEFWVAALTAAVVVCVGVEQGIILAIVVSLILHVNRHYRPRNAVVTWGGGHGARRRPRAAAVVRSACSRDRRRRLHRWAGTVRARGAARAPEHRVRRRRCFTGAPPRARPLRHHANDRA
jgi:sulfate permease, SulP family